MGIRKGLIYRKLGGKLGDCVEENLAAQLHTSGSSDTGRECGVHHFCGEHDAHSAA